MLISITNVRHGTYASARPTCPGFPPLLARHLLCEDFGGDILHKRRRLRALRGRGIQEWFSPLPLISVVICIALR
jgi:hypothetical protein